jgi:hypothetical protein
MARKAQKKERIDPEWALREGAAILAPYLNLFGFKFRLVAQGSSSGGRWAEGEFRCGNRRLEFHFRHSLGQVVYHVDNFRMSHEEYLKVLGAWEIRRYPGFTDDPLEPFRQFLHDLRAITSDFVVGQTEEFVRVAAQRHPAGGGDRI